MFVIGSVCKLLLLLIIVIGNMCYLYLLLLVVCVSGSNWHFILL